MLSINGDIWHMVLFNLIIKQAAEQIANICFGMSTFLSVPAD